MANPKKNGKSRTDSLKQEYDILIIGGGITGANVLWDATLRGYKCLLVEKSDYASGTSQATSKLIHGGLRYLKNLEFGLVRESLRERRILAKISPHAVRPLGFIVPIHSWPERLTLFAGMELYNALSYDRNQDISEDCLIPRYLWNSKAETIYKTSPLDRTKLMGSFQYYDYANINPERHTSEFIFSAKDRGGQAFNYMEVKSITKQNSGGYTVGLLDRESDKLKLVSAKVVVNSAGPWADFVESLAGVAPEKKLVRSKGIHAVVRNICSKECIILQKRDGSHLFVIPWRDKTIIGTTDHVFDDHPENFLVKESEIISLLDEVNRTFGDTRLTLEDVDYYYGGLRPLVEDLDSDSETYSASRKAEVMHYEKEGYLGFFSVLGGKYTTSRSLAENLVNQISEVLPNHVVTTVSRTEPLLGGHYKSKKALAQSLERKFPKASGRKIEQIVSRYGSLSEKVLSYPSGETYLLANGERFYEEEVSYLVENEDIIHATDFYFRRSGVGTVGKMNPDDRKKLDAKLAKLLGWDAKRSGQESKLVDKRYLWFKD